MPQGSSSRHGRQPAKKWEWTKTQNFNLSSNSTNINELCKDFDDKDFRLSRAWLCFAGENANGDLKTNHASLKFDFKHCDNHSWRGVKLEARIQEGVTDKYKVTRQRYTVGAVVLGLKDWAGPPKDMRFCVEINTDFNCVNGATKLGDLIRILSESQLLRFGFLTKESSTGDKAYVGCRDYVAQVLFALEHKQRIKKRPVKGGDRTIATLDRTGDWTFLAQGTQQMLPDIHAALAIYCEERRAPDNRVYTVISSSAVELGCFPDWTATMVREKTADGYPYRVQYPLGTRSDRVVRPGQTYQGGHTGQVGGYGGQVGGYGGQVGGYGGQVGGYGSQVGGYGSQGGGPGGQGPVYGGEYGAQGSSSSASMPGPSGHYPYGY